ncbi:MAG: chemotaxis protein CheA [Thermodesulfobacteriota bacterium]|nr:MAG: chemotaxis protein CheA [Thermodesulfobacteriota bacterium]
MRKKVKKEDRLKEFLAEAEEILTSMEKDLLKFSKGVKAGIIDPAILNNNFRSAHTLKGVSEIFEFKSITELSHALEDKLDLLRLGRIPFTQELLAALMDAHGLLVKIVATGGKKDFTDEVKSIKKILAGCFEKKRPAGKGRIDKEIMSVLTEFEEYRLRENLKQGKNIFLVNVSFPVTSFDKGYLAFTETLGREAEIIATLPSSIADAENLFFDVLAGTYKEKGYIWDLLKGFPGVRISLPGRTEAPEETEKSGEKTQAHAGACAPALHMESLRRTSNSVRVNIEKIDYIMDVVSELGLLHSSLKRLCDELKAEKTFTPCLCDLSKIETDLGRKFLDLRESVLDVRMVPVGRLFSRFETFMQRVAMETNKTIRMVTNGAETEIDKFIIEELADPLMHIVRNVIDHGIEPPDTRVKMGKNREGAITLSAYQRGRHVVVEIKDDGAGIDEEAVCRKAVQKGLISSGAARALSRQEKLELIFMPGFTMTDVVSITSGRGVGLDVVRENITRLCGVIEVDTVKGKGTRFILTIPVTQAIVKALIVEDSRERYALPLSSVSRIVELDIRKDLRGGIVALDDCELPSVRLSRFFGKASVPNGDTYYGVVAGFASNNFCIIVDKLVEEVEVVIKPLPEILKVPGIAGATETCGKEMVLVLDIMGMLDRIVYERENFAPVERIV